jgi:hypothetical protein
VARKKLSGIMVPDWEPLPGSIDLAVLRREELVVAAELKLDDVDQTLWDIYKMASASRMPSVSGAYAVAAAPEKTWSRPLDCVELFLDESSDEWYSEFLFDEYRKAWAHLLKGGTARPTPGWMAGYQSAGFPALIRDRRRRSRLCGRAGYLVDQRLFWQ